MKLDLGLRAATGMADDDHSDITGPRGTRTPQHTIAASEITMLTVTEAAGTRLAQMVRQRGLPDEIAIRFIYGGQGINLQQDSQRAGDMTFKHEGRTVLLLDAQVSELLADDTLDLEGARLTLRHPNEGEHARR
jgi:hypothetical protein